MTIMNKQQTAVDWLINEILKHDKSFVEFYGAEISQAKEMDKERIIAAYQQGVTDEYGDSLDFSNDTRAEEYYNETYE